MRPILSLRLLGDLREDLGILPPGDIRNCILALADTEPLMEELLQYRFTDGRLKNQSFGNLFLAAMDGISENFEDAVQKLSNNGAIEAIASYTAYQDLAAAQAGIRSKGVGR